jgi:hypothetical protein
MTKRKWEKGRSLTALEALAEICAGRPVYFNSKWTHPSWARSWQINMVIGSAGRGRISEAKPIQGNTDERNHD